MLRCCAVAEAQIRSAAPAANLTIFDPATVRDQSTVEDPAQMSQGIEYVLVMGQVVKDRTGIDKTVKAGQPIKGQTA